MEGNTIQSRESSQTRGPSQTRGSSHTREPSQIRGSSRTREPSQTRDSSHTRDPSQTRDSSHTREPSQHKEPSQPRDVFRPKKFYKLRRLYLQQEKLFGSLIIDMSWASIPWASDLQDLKTWREPTEPCSSPTCPVNYATGIPHSVGRYVHNGKRAPRRFGLHSFLFGSCNPPPELLEASDRLEDQNYGGDDDRSIQDMSLIRDFLVHHVKFMTADNFEANQRCDGDLLMGWGRVGR